MSLFLSISSNPASILKPDLELSSYLVSGGRGVTFYVRRPWLKHIRLAVPPKSNVISGPWNFMSII